MLKLSAGHIPSPPLSVSIVGVPSIRMENAILSRLVCVERAIDDECNAASGNCVVIQPHASEGDTCALTSIANEHDNAAHE